MLSLWLLASAAVAELPPPAGRPVDFVKDVRPIFERACLKCHGPDKQRGGFRLDVKAAALEGGDNHAPAILPGKGADSPLIRFVAGLDPDVTMPPQGKPLAPEQVGVLRAWIDQGADWPESASAKLDDPAKTHWAFQPVRRPEVPAIRIPETLVRNPIDAFIVAKLGDAGLAMSPEADRRTLVRRLYLVLHGLPPTPEEVAAFVADDRPDAFEKLVDRLLASPRYGERWARHWLDIIAFGETHGFEVNTPRDNAWPYRDYVIESFNADTPYPRFILEQLAGDALGEDRATGFLVASAALLPGQIGKDEESQLKARQDELNDMVAGAGSAFLGLTLHCARCHDHKFDPVSQSDYYAMQAIFAGTKHGERELRPKPGPSTPARRVYAGTFAQPGPTHRLQRGDPLQPRERVAPGAVVSIGARLQLPDDAPERERRLALARWLGDPTNPLPARVLVNRLWQHHFGEGFVRTPSDFGRNGARPTHPELLDWLASEFVARGWSIKAVQRLIVTSATWRQSGAPRPDALAKDAASHLLWRFPPRRLEAEAIRDSMLAAAGTLDLRMGGPGFLAFAPNTNYVRVYDPKPDYGPADWRRMVYQTKVRMAQDSTFGAFDCPDAGQRQPQRPRSTTPLQALNLFNSRFVAQQADLFAKRLRHEAGDDPSAQVRRAFQLAVGRDPDDDEARSCADLVRAHDLPAFCRVMLNTNEFLFLP